MFFASFGSSQGCDCISNAVDCEDVGSGQWRRVILWEQESAGNLISAKAVMLGKARGKSRIAAFGGGGIKKKERGFF